MEFFHRGPATSWERRLLPLISLDRDYLDQIGKSLALLWIIFLIVGPSAEQVIRFCDRVRCIVSDMGTERKNATMPCMIQEFFVCCIGVQVPALRRRLLFPMCIPSPGWQHGWDLILMRGLRGLGWFPAWLDGIRALISFFRARLLRDSLAKRVQERGFQAISEMLAAVSVPSIAEWRWHTLHIACGKLSGILSTFAAHFDSSLFSNAKDPALIKRISKAMSRQQWFWQFQFVLWFSRWICTIASWGRGSRQRDEANGSDSYDHMHNGRRLPEAETYVLQSLRAGLLESHSWHADSFGAGCTTEDVADLQVCVRASYNLACKRHEYLSKVPYLFAKLLEPGIKQRCIDQYESMQGHSPVTDFF